MTKKPDEIGWPSWSRERHFDLWNAVSPAPVDEAETAPGALDGIVERASGVGVVAFRAVDERRIGQEHGALAGAAGVCGIEGDFLVSFERGSGHCFFLRGTKLVTSEGRIHAKTREYKRKRLAYAR
jgi:hypothetical protein